MIGPSRRRAPLLKSLGDCLQGNPLETFSNVLLGDYMKGLGRVSPERLVDILIHDHFMISPLNFLLLFWISFLMLYSWVFPSPF
jgi:hypothetical protein